MSKINKKDAESLALKQAKLKSEHEEYLQLISKFNSVLKEAVEAFSERYSEEASRLKESMEQTAGELSELATAQSEKLSKYTLFRSDSWYDSDAGISYSNWSEDWECFASSMSDAVDSDIHGMFELFEGISIEPLTFDEMPSLNRPKQ